jgi:two-component system sensor histidine kinase YesM
MKENGESMRFEVRDNGIGMSPERLTSVRKGLDDELTASPNSSGYGLKNVNQRIKLYYGMKWGVSIESEEGVGTLVSIVLPTIG